MALNPHRKLLFSQLSVFFAPAGVQDLPLSTPPGDINVGDLVISGTVATGLASMWVATVGSPNPTWNAVSTTGGTAARSATAPVTAVSSDRYLSITTPGALTLANAGTAGNGAALYVVNNSTGNVTESSTTTTIPAGGHKTFTSNGTTWTAS